MTSLSLQLEKARSAQTEVFNEGYSRGSILYDRQYAKTVSKDDFYKIGCSGFKELLKINSEFEVFEESLFGPKTIDLQRAICDTDFNNNLDKTIEHFLFLLSPYLERHSSLQALEWLIYRFGANSYPKNVDSLLMCALPYYESVLFVRILQIVDLRKKQKLWQWLIKAQKGSVPLSKQVVYSHWAADKGFRSHIQAKIRKMIGFQQKKSKMNVAISFLITTQMGGLNTVAHVKEEHLFSIATSIQWSLNSQITELVAGTYFMIMHLCLKTKLSPSLIDTILIEMFKNFLPELTEQFGLCLLTICNHQEIPKFSDKVIPFMSNKAVLDYISSVAQEKSIASFLSPYVYGKVKLIFSKRDLEKKDGDDDFNVLEKYILQMNITPIEASMVIRSFISSLHKYAKSDKNDVNFCDIPKLVEKLELSHPEGMDRASIEIFTEKSNHKVLEYLDQKQPNFMTIEDPLILTRVIEAILIKNVCKRTTAKGNFHFECIKLMKKCLIKEKRDSDWRDARHQVVQLLVTKNTSKLMPDEKLDIFLMLFKNFSMAETIKDIDEFRFVINSDFGHSIPLCCELGVIFASALRNNQKITHKILSFFWVKFPEVLSTLDLKYQTTILNKIEKIAGDNMEFEDQLFVLRFLQAFMAMEGESFLGYRVSNRLLETTSALLCSARTKFVDDDQKDGFKNSISISFLFKMYQSILSYIEGIFDQSNRKIKTYLIITPSKQDDFNTGMRMLLKIFQDVLIMHQRKIKNVELLINDIFKKVLKTPTIAFRFLSMIWSWHPGMHSEGITIPLKLWALNFANSLIQTDLPKNVVQSLMGPNEAFVSSLFLPLCENDEDLCRATFTLLKNLEKKCSARDGLIPVIKCLLKFKNEIMDDSSFLPTAVSSLKNDQMDIVKKLLQLVINEIVPSHISCTILYLLSGIDEKFIMQELLPIGDSLLKTVDTLTSDSNLNQIDSLNLYYILIRFASSGATFQMGDGWEFFEKCINYPRDVLLVTETNHSPRGLVVNFNVLKHMEFKNDRQLKLLDILLTKAVQSKSNNDAAKLRRELKKITINSAKLVDFLETFNLTMKFKSVREARAKRVATSSTKLPSRENSTALSWQKFGLLVELIGVMKNVHHPWLLVGPLCKYLSESFQLDLAVSDIIQQKILSLLLHILELSIRDLKQDLFGHKVQLDVVVIVRCIRVSPNPDIHRRALLILSIATPYFPDQVLHSIMPIFTFMGNSLVRRDDAYSFQVIHSTISSIIPTLIKSDNSNPGILLKKLADVAQVFVDALPDIANHRRLPLFTQLAKTMGVTEHLWLVMVLIADSYIMKPTSDGHIPGTLPSNIQFALLLYSQFSVVEQLGASSEVANFLFALPEEKNSSIFSKLSPKESSYVKIINFDIHSPKELKHLKYTCLGLILRLLTSEIFIGQVYEITTKNDESEIGKLKHLYINLLEKGLNEIKTLSSERRTKKDHQPSHFEIAMEKKLISFVDAINSLLPPAQLIDVVKSLLKSDNAVLRCRAMEILAQKLQLDGEFFGEEHDQSLIKICPMLNQAGANSCDPEVNQQTASYTLQLIVRMLGKSMRLSVIENIVKSHCKIIVCENVSYPLKAQGILVIGETVSLLKAGILPYLKSLLPLLISLLDDVQSEFLLLAAASTLQRLVEFVPQFTHKYIPSIIVSSCCILAKIKSDSIEKESTSFESRIHTKLSGIHHRIIEKIEPRIVVPSFCAAYKELIKNDKMYALPAHLQFIESFINEINSDILLVHKNELITLFMETLDVRMAPIDTTEMLELEDSVISALSRFLLKLNEDDNLRIFINLITWSKNVEHPHRLITFFKFSDKLASILKVLFIKTKLADKLLLYAANMLEKEETWADELLRFIFMSLTKVFTYDSVQFMNEDRFNLVSGPLISQIENVVGGDDLFQTRVHDYLKPCIVSLTKALTDDSLWRKLNKEILMKLRINGEPQVTLACLEVFEGLVEGLGEDYLQPLLGDTMPYITEVVESLDVNVQNRTKELFGKMEAILGDDLRAYLS